MPMPPDQRKVLHYFGYLYPIIFIGLGAGGLIVAALARTSLGMMIAGLFGVGFMALGSFLAWRHSKQDPTTPVPTLNDYPPQEQARQIRASMRLIAVVTILFGGYMAYQIMQVEYGWAQHVRAGSPSLTSTNSSAFGLRSCAFRSWDC